MTVHLPLDPSSPIPSQPSFLVPATNPASQLSRVIHAIMKAKRIVVICGAGISVQAGIPDFRSSDGLFQSIKRDNPREAMSSGKELFDVSVFNSEQKTSLFCQMIAQLSDLSQAAEPTSFHHVLRALDDRGRLLRVYTQNIDAIEQKCGLSFGVPEFEGKRAKPRSRGKAAAAKQPVDDQSLSDIVADDSHTNTIASTSRLPSPSVTETPRCIPLHGTLQSMHCQICNHSFPLQAYLPSLNSGQPPPCPECTALEATRQLVGKRPRGIGKLRPSVVLYNEAHKDGEGVGDVVKRDLIGSSKGKGRSGADLLLVVGTSLRVPGTKRMVREFAKAVRARGGSSSAQKDETLTPGGPGFGLATPVPSPRRSPTTAADEDAVPKAVYLNLDFPVPTREWEGVFDAWIQGDAQAFAEVLRKEIEKEAKAKEVAVEKKKKKDEEAALAAATEHEMPDYARIHLEKAKEEKITGKRKHDKLNAHHTSSSRKRRKTATLTFPPALPHAPSSSVPSLLPDERNVSSSKLVLRIPPMRSRICYVPEVYITTRPPFYKAPASQYVTSYDLASFKERQRRIKSARSPSPMNVDSNDVDGALDVVSDRSTLSKQPLSLPSFNKRTKAGRKAARAAQDLKRKEKLAQSRLHYPGQQRHQHQSISRPSCSFSVSHGTPAPSPSHHHTPQQIGRVDHNRDYLSLSSTMIRTLQLGIREPA